MVRIEYLGATYAETEQRVQRNLNQVVVFFKTTQSFLLSSICTTRSETENLIN